MMYRLIPLAATLLAASAAQADWVTVSDAGTPVLSVCNPKTGKGGQQTQDPNLSTCKVDGLPGSPSMPGYTRIKATSTPITVNTVQVGTLHDWVWCAGTSQVCDGSNSYILGTRVELNDSTDWGSTGESFEINDFTRAIKPDQPAQIAYFMGTVDNGTSAATAKAYKYMEYAGRTRKGLGEYAGSKKGDLNPTRNNAWIDFRSDTNADDPDANPPFSFSSPWSPWMMVHQICANGIKPAQVGNKLRLHQGGEEGQPDVEVYASAYVCK
ncbi:hypothetical protein KAK06_04035 [Ideonella sp. 4Y11]|uniref:DUF4360 domain-containing protein n=1 Tax=Ideonella aquatica TaxID=2824119 RepID=A0A940YRJ8_9BURK|nr:hypothetical protein [Ideonella aquatica]MBQ0958120.1 hypothetical protein [Ideonella aquatica]